MSTPLRQDTTKGTMSLSVAPPANHALAGVKPTASKTHVQNMMVEIKGSLSGFHMIGPEAATWRPMEGKHGAIFSGAGYDHGNMSADVGGEISGTGIEMASTADKLRNARIKKATILQSKNTFDVPLGVTINCLPRTEAVDTGDKYTFTTIPKTTVNTPQVVFEAGETHSALATWRDAFPSFNNKNLETQGVLTLQNCPYVFVNENHPVVSLIRANKASLGVDIDEMPKMDGEWYKLATPLMSSCCETIKTKILKNIQPEEEMDLGQLCVQLHRLSDVPWNHADKADVLSSFMPSPDWTHDKLKEEIKAHESRFLQTPATFMARLQLEYELPE